MYQSNRTKDSKALKNLHSDENTCFEGIFGENASLLHDYDKNEIIVTECLEIMYGQRCKKCKRKQAKTAKYRKHKA